MSEDKHRENIDELTKAILKHNLLSAENTEKLQNNYSGDGVAESFIGNAKTMLKNADDPQRQHKICSIVTMIGGRLQMEKVQAWGEKKLQEWQATHRNPQPQQHE